MFTKKSWYKRSFIKATNQDAILIIALGGLAFQALGQLTEMATKSVTNLFSKIKAK